MSHFPNAIAAQTTAALIRMATVTGCAAVLQTTASLQIPRNTQLPIVVSALKKKTLRRKNRQQPCCCVPYLLCSLVTYCMPAKRTIEIKKMCKFISYTQKAVAIFNQLLKNFQRRRENHVHNIVYQNNYELPKQYLKNKNFKIINMEGR